MQDVRCVELLHFTCDHASTHLVLISRWQSSLLFTCITQHSLRYVRADLTHILVHFRFEPEGHLLILQDPCSIPPTRPWCVLRSTSRSIVPIYLSPFQGTSIAYITFRFICPCILHCWQILCVWHIILQTIVWQGIAPLLHSILGIAR